MISPFNEFDGYIIGNTVVYPFPSENLGNLEEFGLVYKNRVAPKLITSLEPNEVFVFGSNLSGIHGAGAAKMARQWGAVLGLGVGRAGQTYAIPTKSPTIKTIPLSIIEHYVKQFIEYASWSTDEFLVTEIGCGLAGYTVREIAPMFEEAKWYNNIHLPLSFWEFLK